MNGTIESMVTINGSEYEALRARIAALEASLAHADEQAKKVEAAIWPTAELNGKLLARIERLEARNAELLEGLKEAREDVNSWASYASDYFKDKWDLDADLARIDALIAKAENKND